MSQPTVWALIQQMPNFELARTLRQEVMSDNFEAMIIREALARLLTNPEPIRETKPATKKSHR